MGSRSVEVAHKSEKPAMKSLAERRAPSRPQNVARLPNKSAKPAAAAPAKGKAAAAGGGADEQWEEF